MSTLALSLDSEINLARLLTPACSCVCLRAGRIEKSTLQILKERDFEFAPVLGPGGNFIGISKTQIAAELERSGKELSADVLIAPLPSLTVRTSMNRMLVELAGTGVAAIIEQADDEGTLPEWIGLITASDLNRHYFRVLVYEWLAELEVGLVRMIERYAGPHEAWIRALQEDAQARILGYWQVSKMNGADIGPLAACMLTDLTKIAKLSKNVLAALQLSKTKFHDRVGGLPQLRNQVMHPVRPMVVKAEDVNKIHGHLKDADFLISLISQAASI
jgi:hypothetical protein